MSTVRTEKEDPQNDINQPREKGGQTQEDRAKGFGDGESGPFDETENNPKRKE